MKEKIFYKLFILFVFLFLQNQKLYSQFSDPILQKNYKIAINEFNKKKYSKALSLFLYFDTIKTNNNKIKKILLEIKYKISVCYINFEAQERFKAIPFLEKIIKQNLYKFPNKAYIELAILYHSDYQFKKAIEILNVFQKRVSKRNENYKFSIRMIEICKSAEKIISRKPSIHLENLRNISMPLNMINSDYNPIILPDLNVMYFIALNSKSGEKEIKVSHKEIGIWKKSKTININLGKKIDINSISLAGISYDGNILFFQKKEKKRADIYFSEKRNNSFGLLQKLDANVNSKYLEGKIYINKKGDEIYFSSDRPGGYGGKDIYKVKKLGNNKWSKAINLGENINTSYDEDAPFVHSNSHTIYFSSKGHNTMGGYDIFKSKILENDKFELAENLSYPINTPQDNLYYVISDSENSAYLSSVKKSNPNYHEIFFIDLKSSIEQSMINGNIFTKNMKPIKASVKVINKETNKKENYIFTPNYKIGKFLMIIPPGKEYKMLIETKNFTIQNIDIRIPNQTYFYKMFQKIILENVFLLGKKVGEKTIIENSFYDNYKKGIESRLNSEELKKIKRYRNKLFQYLKKIKKTSKDLGPDKVRKLMSKTEIPDVKEKDNSNLLLNFIEKAIENVDSTALEELGKNTLYVENYENTFFIPTGEKNDDDLERIEINNKIIKTAPTIRAILQNSEENSLQKKETIINDNSINVNKKYITTYSVYFRQGASDFDVNYNNKYFAKNLDEIARFLINNEKIAVELQGYADSKGDRIKNFKLSNERAKAIKDIFIAGMDNRKRIFNNKNKLSIISFGDTKSRNEVTEEDRRKNRRVDIKIFELN